MFAVMPRITINIPDEMLAEIDALADANFCTRSSAVRQLYGQKWSEPHQPASTCINLHQVSHPSPDPARAPAPARVDDDSQTDSQSEGTDSKISDLVGLIRGLPWYGAKLAKSSTPETFAVRLLGSYPGVDIEAELHKASGWLEDHPDRRKKQLGAFLMRWMGSAGRGTTGPPRRPTTRRQASFDMPDPDDPIWLEGTDDI